MGFNKNKQTKKKENFNWTRVVYQSESEIDRVLGGKYLFQYSNKFGNGGKKFYRCPQKNCPTRKCVFVGQNDFYIESRGNCTHDITKMKTGLPNDVLNYINKLFVQEEDKSKSDLQPLTFSTVWNKLNEYYENDIRFLENNDRDLMRIKVSNRVKNFNKKIKGKYTKKIEDATSLQKYIDATKIQYPKKPFEIPTNLKQVQFVCDALEISLPKKNNKEQLSPGRSMISLPIPTVLEEPKMEKVYTTLNKNSEVEKMFVFSSMNLLFNVCESQTNLQMKILGTIDGTHKVCANSYILIAFGTYNYQRKTRNGTIEWTNSFRPFAYCFCPSETECASIVLMCSVNYAVRRLFGIILEFRNGVVCDRADAFCNAYAHVYPDSIRGQCWPHVAFKFQHSTMYYNGMKKKLRKATNLI